MKNLLPELEFNFLYRLSKGEPHKITKEKEAILLSEAADTRLSLVSIFSADNFHQQWSVLLKILQEFQFIRLFKLQGGLQQSVWHIYGDYQQLQDLIEKHIRQTKFDYLLWPKLCTQPPALLLFDMDSTFIEIEVIDELAKRHNVGDKVSKITAAAMAGDLDFSQSLIARVKCLAGLSESVISDIAESLPISKGVERLVKNAQQKHCKIAIASGGFMPFAEKLKMKLDLFAVHANKLAINKKKLTGKVKGDIVDAQAKADYLLQLCNELGISPSQVMAIGDGANDLKMMALAGFNLAYQAKPRVEQQATGRIKQTHLGVLSDVFGWSS